MGYNSSVKYQGNGNKSVSNKPVAAEKKASSTLWSTGLFSSDKSMATVQVREDITIPAGSYINIYQNEAGAKTQSGKDAPPFKLTVKAGVLKQRA
jgi:hypothetical protein